MKQPSGRTKFLAHPVIGMPVTAVGAVFLWAAFQGSNLLVGFMAVCLIGAAQQAREQVNAYKAWEREWNGMAAGSQPARKRSWGAWAVVGLGLVWWGLACASGYDPYKGAVGTLGLMAVSAIAIQFLKMAWRIIPRLRRPSAKSAVVTVIARPVMPTPSLTDAYCALPSYCHALLGGQQ